MTKPARVPDYEISCSRDLAMRLGALCPMIPQHFAQLQASMNWSRYIVMRDSAGLPMFWPMHQLEETSS